MLVVVERNAKQVPAQEQLKEEMSQLLTLLCQSRNAKPEKMPQFSGRNMCWAVSAVVADLCAKARGWNPWI